MKQCLTRLLCYSCQSGNNGNRHACFVCVSVCLFVCVEGGIGTYKKTGSQLPFLTNRDLSTLMFICQQIRLLCSAPNFVQDGFLLEPIMNSCHFFCHGRIPEVGNQVSQIFSPMKVQTGLDLTTF